MLKGVLKIYNIITLFGAVHIYVSVVLHWGAYIYIYIEATEDINIVDFFLKTYNISNTYNHTLFCIRTIQYL